MASRQLSVWLLDPANLTPYYNLALCEALTRAGCDVRYITSRFLYDDHLPQSNRFRSDELYFRGLNQALLIQAPMLRRLLRGLSYPFGHRRVLKQIKQNPPDILHIQWCRLPRIDKWFIERVQRIGLPIVLTVHEVVPLYNQSAPLRQLGAIYEMADAIIVLTEASRAKLLELFPQIDVKRVRIVPLLDSDYVQVPEGVSRGVARSTLKLPSGVPVVLYFGTIKHYKGLDVLVEAIPQVHRERSDVHFLIAGNPDESEQVVVQAVTELPNTKVHAWFVAYGDVWRYFYASDVVVFPYRDVYQSAALTTAMGFGKPVIVTNVGGFAEMLDGNGWLVPTEKPDELADAILDAVSDAHRLVQMGRQSRMLIEQLYAPDVIAEHTTNLYQTVLARRGDAQAR